jgi:hypothetical protein
MAISLVAANTGGSANGGDVTINLPGSPQENDVVVVMGGHANGGSNQAGTNTSGYSRVIHTANTDCRLSVSYKRMGSSPDSTVSCKGSGVGTDATAYIVMVFRGVNPTGDVLDATSQDTTGNNDNPNSPSVSVATAGTAVVSCFIQASDESNIDPPSGYGNSTELSRTETAPVTVGAAWKAVSAGTENPGPWDSGTSAKWVAGAIALSPEVATINADGVLSATGRGTAGLASGTHFQAKYVATGTGTAAFTGGSLSTQPAPFAMTGTASVDWSGGIGNGGALSATGEVTVLFVGARDQMRSVREVIESKGAATVSIR